MEEKIYLIGNMDCANCAREVETGVAGLEGVRHVRVDFTTGKMSLEGDVPFDILQGRVRALGKTISPLTSRHEIEKKALRKGLSGFWDYLFSRKETRLALTGAVITLVTFLTSSFFMLPAAGSAGGYTLAMAIALLPVARSGFNTLRLNRTFSINLLMTIAAVGAVIIGEYLEAFTLVFLFAIGEALEGYAAERTRDSLRSLVALKPEEAILLKNGEELRVHVDTLCVDDTILIKSGERIPMDGLVTAGESSVSQAPITGESMPVPKTLSDRVFAGTVNHEGVLEVRVTHLVADNTLSRIIHLVEEAQSVRAPSQRVVDRFAHYYTPAVVLIALLAATLPPLLFGAPFWNSGGGHGWLYRALALLVIACPCALVISTPVTVISAITAAARRGVLIKGGAYLEALGQVKALAFDKTGTLTQGKPAVTTLRAADCELEGDCPRCEDVLALAAAVESRSTHPLAQAVIQAAVEHHVDRAYASAERIETLAGRGIQGYINERRVTVGSHPFFDRMYPHS